jgi:mono/diheme cytochrome c family protein
VSVSARHQILSLAGVSMLAVTLVTASCGGSGAQAAGPTLPADGPRDASGLFVAACGACHGPLGEGGLSGVPLGEYSAADRQAVISAIRYGVGGMPASSNGMSDEQIEALAEYVAGLRR